MDSGGQTPNSPGANLKCGNGSTESKPKRIRRNHHRRPKTLPLNVRQRLAELGHALKVTDTSDNNLSDLVGKLSHDLEAYQIQAQQWQNKFLALTKGSTSNANQLNQTDTDQEGEEVDLIEVGSELIPSQNSGALRPLTKFECHIISGIQAATRPSLTMAGLSPPWVESTSVVARLTPEQQILYREEVFGSFSSMAGVFGMYNPKVTKWSGITKIKPDFTETRAIEVWNRLFSPISTSSGNIGIEGSPPCRRDSLDPDLDEMDSLDDYLATATDFDVIDTLHYASLILGGITQCFANTGELQTSLRRHIGLFCERLIKEIVFTRNTTTSPELAQGIVQGLIGMIRYFEVQQRLGAVSSLLEIGWSVANSHQENVHPIMRGMISFISTVVAPTLAARAMWARRSQQNLNSTSENYFHLRVTAHFAKCIWDTVNNDEDSLLEHLNKLDQILAPGNASYFENDNRFLFDPSSGPVAVFDEPSSSSSSSPVTSPSLDTQMATAFSESEGSSHGTSSYSAPTSSYFEPPAVSREFVYPTSPDVFSEDSSDKTPFIPDERFKGLLRASVCLLRADAALIRNNEAMCISWVDEAESLIRSSTPIGILQRLLIIDTQLLESVYTRKCHFPSGHHTVASEMERRLVIIEQELGLSGAQFSSILDESLNPKPKPITNSPSNGVSKTTTAGNNGNNNNNNNGNNPTRPLNSPADHPKYTTSNPLGRNWSISNAGYSKTWVETPTNVEFLHDLQKKSQQQSSILPQQQQSSTHMPQQSTPIQQPLHQKQQIHQETSQRIQQQQQQQQNQSFSQMNPSTFGQHIVTPPCTFTTTHSSSSTAGPAHACASNPKISSSTVLAKDIAYNTSNYHPANIASAEYYNQQQQYTYQYQQPLHQQQHLYQHNHQLQQRNQTYNQQHNQQQRSSFSGVSSNDPLKSDPANCQSNYHCLASSSEVMQEDVEARRLFGFKEDPCFLNSEPPLGALAGVLTSSSGSSYSSLEQHLPPYFSENGIPSQSLSTSTLLQMSGDDSFGVLPIPGSPPFINQNLGYDPYI